MSGALKGVMGGGGILGSLLSIASMVFPPLQMAASLANLATNIAGQAVKGAVDILTKEGGMPKFLGDAIKSMVDGVTGQQQQQSSNECDDCVQKAMGGDAQNLAQESAQDIAQRAMAKMRKDGLENADEHRQKAKSGAGKKSAGSWLEAIAQAMGEVLGEKAGKMVELSNKIASTTGEQGKAAAKANAEATTEMQATSQMFSLMQNAFANAIKGIGEGLSQMARKGG